MMGYKVMRDKKLCVLHGLTSSSAISSGITSLRDSLRGRLKEGEQRKAVPTYQLIIRHPTCRTAGTAPESWAGPERRAKCRCWACPGCCWVRCEIKRQEQFRAHRNMRYSMSIWESPANKGREVSISTGRRGTGIKQCQYP